MSYSWTLEPTQKVKCLAIMAMDSNGYPLAMTKALQFAVEAGLPIEFVDLRNLKIVIFDRCFFVCLLEAI